MKAKITTSGGWKSISRLVWAKLNINLNTCKPKILENNNSSLTAWITILTWCKGAQCSMVGKLKQIKILSLKFFVVTSLLLKYEEVL
jgi:hypothetical protein